MFPLCNPKLLLSENPENRQVDGVLYGSQVPVTTSLTLPEGPTPQGQSALGYPNLVSWNAASILPHFGSCAILSSHNTGTIF